MFSAPRSRLALALGDQELEWRLRPVLELDEQLEITVDCLSAEQLVSVVDSRQADLLLVAWGLHRLSEPLLEQVAHSGLPMLLLVPDPADERWKDRRFQVLAHDAEAKAVHEALLEAQRGQIVRSRPRSKPQPVPLKPEDHAATAEAELQILAVASGAGSPGRTTVAISLAAALGSVAPTVLVDVDLTAPALAAYLDRDPSRNICTLAHAVRESPHVWSQALADELQVLTPRVPHAVALCGLPKREMRSSISSALLQRLVPELSTRYRFVILDVGEQLLGTDPAVIAHRTALGLAQQVLLVSRSDVVGLWHTRVVLKQLEQQLGLDPSRIALVLNRHDARHHHSPSEIAWHLGAGVAAIVPYDHAAAERAIVEQRPLAMDRASRAGKAIIELAERVWQGRIHLADPEAQAARSWWRPWTARRRPPVGGPPETAAGQAHLAGGGRREGRAW